MKRPSESNKTSFVATATLLLVLGGARAFVPSTFRRTSDVGSVNLPSFRDVRPPSPLFMSTALYQMKVNGTAAPKASKRPSRPDRKRMERARKHRKKGEKKQKPPPPKVEMKPLCPEGSTLDELYKAIKHAHKIHSEEDLEILTEFLVHKVDATFGYGYRGSLLSRVAVASLSMNRLDLAEAALDVRTRDHSGAFDPRESAAIVRALDRAGHMDRAEAVVREELALPAVFEGGGGAEATEEEKQVLVQRTLALRSIALWDFLSDDAQGGVATMEKVAALGPAVRRSKVDMQEDLKMNWERLVEVAAQCDARRRKTHADAGDDDAAKNKNKEEGLPCNLVYSVLNTMTTFPSENTNAIYEQLANALVRRVEFVTGAVSFDNLPKPDRGEVTFIGRSNVGKSSLVNMITNRKSLAYTSKTPGKTQQYNYFAVNDKPELAREIRFGDTVPGAKDPDAFYLVDLPGFGFAKVPQAQRLAWSDFLARYLRDRPNLRTVFHLVDARHGPVAEDENIMRLAAQELKTRKDVQYVVVLTKADKNVKVAQTDEGRVSKKVMEDVRGAMQRAGVGRNVPVLLTSAETKLGRDDVWRYLRAAAEL
uniref:EngB-type G domain-containing protein n=1 Tax=Corethron hystrix TaxID=216773 RepID=A0A7S1BPM9_9STRA|mmetsp:Transcript_35151/g.81280  ORF Transcript_35151/g.81280 Transcript_35151/m.81280 type:complete len:594 (+) Transcript_35151:346-2127(+)